MKIALNSYWKFTTYATVTPKYTPKSNVPVITAIPDVGMFKWHVKVVIRCDNFITDVFSPSHHNIVVSSFP